MILASQKVWVVAASQVATAIAGAAIVPAVSGIALGMVRQAGFPRQNGRNQAFNHAGNVAGAALSGLLGWRFGLPAVFWLAAAFGALSIGSVLRIRPESIDDVAARGLEGSGCEQRQRLQGVATKQAAAGARGRAGLLSSRQRRDVAALRACDGEQQTRRPGEPRRHHHRGRASRDDRRFARRDAHGREARLLVEVRGASTSDRAR